MSGNQNDTSERAYRPGRVNELILASFIAWYDARTELERLYQQSLAAGWQSPAAEAYRAALLAATAEINEAISILGASLRAFSVTPEQAQAAREGRQ